MKNHLAATAIFAGILASGSVSAYEFNQWNGTRMECWDEVITAQPVSRTQTNTWPNGAHRDRTVPLPMATLDQRSASAKPASAARQRIKQHCRPLIEKD